MRYFAQRAFVRDVGEKCRLCIVRGAGGRLEEVGGAEERRVAGQDVSWHFVGVWSGEISSTEHGDSAVWIAHRSSGGWVRFTFARYSNANFTRETRWSCKASAATPASRSFTCTRRITSSSVSTYSEYGPNTDNSPSSSNKLTRDVAKMPQFQMRNTVERLDKPSSYAMSKVPTPRSKLPPTQ